MYISPLFIWTESGLDARTCVTLDSGWVGGTEESSILEKVVND